MIFELRTVKWAYEDQAEVVRLARLGFKFWFDREAFAHVKAPSRIWRYDEKCPVSIEIKSLDDLMALVHDWPGEGVIIVDGTITIYNDYYE